MRSATTSTTTKNMNTLQVYGFYTEVEEDELGVDSESEGSISSLLNYLDSKKSEMVRMMNAVDVVSEMMPKGRLHDRDPRAEAKQDWAKMQGGMSARRASVERKISYSQFRKRLIAFGYK